MLLILRLLLTALYVSLVCILGSIYCLFNPRHPAHVARFARLFGRLSLLFGITVESRFAAATQPKQCIYIANHQNNYDMISMSRVIQSNTITVGKKSLLWFPLFGPLYWLTGNLLIDRNKRLKARSIIAQIVAEMQNKAVSIWMFPEGTRSRDRGLLPFKTGAFHAAITAGVPIVPVCVSSTSGNINLNNWSNGRVLIEVLAPIDTLTYTKDRAQELAQYCHQLMQQKIAALDQELALDNLPR